MALAAAVLAASLFYAPLPFALAIGIPFFLYFVSRPYELLLVMVFLIPFNFIIPVGRVPIAAELLKVFAWIPFLIHQHNRGLALKTSRYNKWFAVWAGIILLSILRSHDLPYTLKESVRLGSNLGLCYLVINLVDSREKVLQVFRVLAFSALLVALYGFYQWAIQDYGALFWIVNPRLDTGFSPGRYTFWEWRDRIISVLTSEMELGHYFNMCLPIAVVLWLTGRRHGSGKKWLLVALCSIAGLILTFTFGAWLSLVVTTVLLVLLLDRKRRWKMVWAGLSSFGIAATVVLYGPLRVFVRDKLLGMGIGGLAWDVYTRLDAWSFAVQTWRSHPWLGVGVGNYEDIESSHQLVNSPWAVGGSTPHETYFYLLAIGGLIGLAAMLAIWLGSLLTNFRLRGNPRWGLIALGLAFAITVNMVGGFSDDSTFVGPHTGYLLWLFVGLSEAVWNLSLRNSPVETSLVVAAE